MELKVVLCFEAVNCVQVSEVGIGLYIERFNLLWSYESKEPATSIEDTYSGFAAARMTSHGTADTGKCEIFIQQRKNHGPATKSAKRTWYPNDNNKITEACAQGLGFSILEEGGGKKKSLRLKWGLKGFPTTRVDEFLIIAQGDHEIFLGSDACDWLQRVMNPGSYPVFAGTGTHNSRET